MFVWRRSSHSNQQGGNCVELAVAPGRAGVRDSKNQAGPVLAFGPDRLTSFLEWVKRG